MIWNRYLKPVLLFLWVLLFAAHLAEGQTPNGTGLLFDDNAYAQVPLKARNVGFRDVLADIKSASLKSYVPEVGNQGNFGTCVGWSCAYYGRSILYARFHGITDQRDITRYAFSPSFTYLHANDPDDQNCSDGAYMNRALESMVEDGSPFYVDFSIGCGVEIPEEVRKKAKENPIKDYTRLFAPSEADEVKIASVKRALVNKNPVVAGFEIGPAFFRAKEVYQPDGQKATGGHAMCIVGFDDTKYGGAFEIVNSWGKQWGNEGYVWYRYSDFVNDARYAYEMVPKATTVEVIKKTLGGRLTLALDDGSDMTVKVGEGNYKRSVLGWQQVVVEDSVQSIGDYFTDRPYAEGTRYQMRVEVEKPCYVYVFGADSENRNGVLFPHKPDISAYIAYAGTEVIIPGERYWFKLNGDIDSDYSIVLFSEDKLDTEDVLAQLDSLDGTLLDKLYVIFKDQLIGKKDIQLAKEGIGFSASYTQGSLAMLLVDIKRN